jgi:hypothetical protein
LFVTASNIRPVMVFFFAGVSFFVDKEKILKSV